uniref:Farnesol dehydrogenase-like n=1 Tax=Diabrotica virgifera virgifera TaxID=50390 RepID=A0A6P7GNI2_DIAVI
MPGCYPGQHSTLPTWLELFWRKSHILYFNGQLTQLAIQIQYVRFSPKKFQPREKSSVMPWVKIMERWIGKVAIVTGASSGIGVAVAERLVDEGMMVVGLARRVDKMEELARTLANRRGSFHPIRCDVSIKQDILDAFQTVKETLGPIHVLVNNAGIARVTHTLCSGDSEAWNETFLVNVL